jgi:GcrA cell cycle regulator
MMLSPNWTPEEDARLRLLWGTIPALPCREIANQIGKTKSSIIGRAHRLDLAKRRQHDMPRAPYVRPTRHHPISPARLVVPKRQPPSSPRRSGAMLLDLEPDQCRWPFGERDYTFCAAEVKPERPYCKAHCRLAYRPADNRVVR